MEHLKESLKRPDNKIYYRPPWTCGKYNASKHVAIMFNLLEGFDYFFENESADVVGRILEVGKGNGVSTGLISEALRIEQDSINAFFNKLADYGLLSEETISDKTIADYRCKVKEQKKSGLVEDVSIGNDSMSNALEAYTNAVIDNEKVISVMFELTYRCSEMCIHCYNKGATRNGDEISHRGDTKELTILDYKRIIDELCDAGMVTASLSGGDPFSYPNTWEIIDYLVRKDVAITIYTNGLRLEGQESRLSQYYPREINLSLYSGISTVHDNITRIKGSWLRTINVIEKLTNQSIAVSINCPVMTYNVDSYQAVKAIAQKYHACVVFDLNIIDSMDGDTCASNHLRLKPQQLEVVLQDKDVSGYVNKDNPSSVEGSGMINDDGIPCSGGKSFFCVTPNGDFTPCNCFQLTFGNLKDDHLKNILKTSVPLQEWRNTKFAQYIECWTHEYCAYCNFCPGTNYNEHGNPLKAGENNCYMAKNRYSIAMKIKANQPLLNTLDITNKDSELHREYREGKKKAL